MKTKELKKIVEDNGYIFRKVLTSIYIKNYNSAIVMKMNQDVDIHLGEGYFLSSNKIKTVMKALIEYSETPIEEREEEKKYYIVLPDCFGEYGYLTQYTRNNTYFFSSKQMTEVCITKFIQSEIDNFPPEIKGAIECGFLKKVEVEE